MVRYGKLVEDIWKIFTKGNNYYPADLTEAYNILINYKTSHSKLAARLVEYTEKV